MPYDYHQLLLRPRFAAHLLGRLHGRGDVGPQLQLFLQLSGLSHYVMANPELATSAPRVWEFLSRFVMTPDDTSELYRLLRLQLVLYPEQIEPPDYKRLARSWITNHTDRWLPWISPPAQCSTQDLMYSHSLCGSSTSSVTVTYTWAQPKACQLGIPLPPPDTFRVRSDRWPCAVSRSP